MSSVVGPTGGDNNPYRAISSQQTTQEINRLKYNAKEKTFEPLISFSTAKTERMEQVENKINKLQIPPDCTSPTFLKKIAPPNQSKGTKIQTGTEGAGKYMSGDVSLYHPFISSISRAQRSLS